MQTATQPLSGAPVQITKIVITGDTQRPLSQRGNVDILANLLRLPIKLATGIDIEVCYPDNLLSLEDWVKAQKVVSSKERPYWLWDRYDLSTTAFIGFEMPEIAMAQAFEGDVAATVVDMRISPVRFGDDLYFSMRSSPDYKFCSVSPFQVRYEADMMKAAVMRLPGMGCPPDVPAWMPPGGGPGRSYRPPPGVPSYPPAHGCNGSVPRY